jgi:hypothetical protein
MLYSALAFLVLIAQDAHIKGAAETKGACSPANTGDRNVFNITCGIGKAQGDRIIAILNKILADQLEPAAVIAKLDEILNAVNPNSTIITYTLNGLKRTSSPGRVFAGDDAVDAFRRIMQLSQLREWAALATFCEEQMKSRPEWLTPYSAAGEAYLRMGQREKARALLDYAEKRIAGNPDYDGIKVRISSLVKEAETPR